VPVSADAVARPTALLCTQLIRGLDLDEQSNVLVGLLQATGLDQPVLWEVRQSGPEALRRRLAQCAARLGPSLRELLTQTEAAVGSAIASNRV
jgi:hypothetical protein